MLSLIEAIEASCWLLISEECFGAMNSEIKQQSTTNWLQLSFNSNVTLVASCGSQFGFLAVVDSFELNQSKKFD